MRFSQTSFSKVTFKVTQTDAKSLLVYLQDGLEIPYWKLMLDVFFEYRANESLIGGDVLSLSLTACKTAARQMRRQLIRVLETVGVDEKIDGILRGIDKRIDTLDAFTDGSLPDLEAEDAIFELMLPDRVNKSASAQHSEPDTETDGPVTAEISKVRVFPVIYSL